MQIFSSHKNRLSDRNFDPFSSETTLTLLLPSHVCQMSFCVSAEVLLDMSASGSELGWLTLPYESGVSIQTRTTS